MSKVWVTDEEGEGLWLKRTKKNRYLGLTFDENITENISNVPLRKDDILLCCYAKTGTHWIWENMRILISGEIKYDEVEKESQMMEYFDNLEDMPSPRLLNNHAFFDDQPRDLLKGNTKVVFLYRNPKDVAYSLYQHHKNLPAYEYNGKFSNFQKRFVQGKVLNSSYFEYLQSWEQGLKNNPAIPFLLVRYEDFHENPVTERRRLSKFIGCDYDDEFLQKVIEATDIDTMRRLKAETTLRLKGSDGISFVYRKGKVGGWMDHFSKEESEWFDQVVEREMGDSQLFRFKYTLD